MVSIIVSGAAYCRTASRKAPSSKPRSHQTFGIRKLKLCSSRASLPSSGFSGGTIDFLLSPKRDLTAAKLFLRLALSETGGIRPRVVNLDGIPGVQKQSS